jgi:glycogen operon protein
VFSSRASRLELWLYAEPFGAPEVARIPMTRDADRWVASVPASGRAAHGLAGRTVYYGYRAWGPNWPFEAAWRPGSTAGFRADVDRSGNRFNPNKVLLDPWAREVSHDPRNARQTDESLYCSGVNRAVDTGPFAPKGLVLPAAQTRFAAGLKPARPFKDDIVYEVHLRGFTRNDPSVPAELRGTYAGAALKADYLRALGVTAVEFLPLAEFQNEQNDLQLSSKGGNYWGYDPLAYFAPDRRYAADRSPGGPTREFRAMTRAFHDKGLKVFVDVVYNHTGEGGLWSAAPGRRGDTCKLLSLRGLDNPAYYETMNERRFYREDSGCGPNVNSADPAARRLIFESLEYWKDVLGVDGFRFDLAPILANRWRTEGFEFDASAPGNPLLRAARELPVRAPSGLGGVDLIAEPWGGCYALGRHPAGFAEWNDRFRDAFRRSQNRFGRDSMPLREVALRVAGSPDIFQEARGRRPWNSVNFVVAHDGFTLRDLVSFNQRATGRPWPYGPSDGGRPAAEELSWDQGGGREAQRQAARNGLAFLMVSAGVPMLTGGDEMFRTQYGNNNPYNLDSEANWLDWGLAFREAPMVEFARGLMAFRAAHKCFRPWGFFRGSDEDGNGLPDLAWLGPDGAPATDAELDRPDGPFLAWRFDGAEASDSDASVYVAYNRAPGALRVKLPPNLPGKSWRLAFDTAGGPQGRGRTFAAGREPLVDGGWLPMAGRSLAACVER